MNKKQFFRVVLVMLSVVVSGCSQQQHTANIADIKKLDKIRVLRVRVAETLSMTTKNASIDYLVVGNGDYEIELSKIKFKQKEGKLCLEVASPDVDSLVDYEETRAFKTWVAVGYTDSALHKMRKKMPEEAMKLVSRASVSEEYMNIAKEHAERILKEMLLASDTNVVEIRWVDDE